MDALDMAHREVEAVRKSLADTERRVDALQEERGKLSASVSVLQAELRTAVSALRDEADLLDQWAHQSEKSGWSTHQVKPQRERADVLRRLVATLERGS